jgi:hypothetical protein
MCHFTHDKNNKEGRSKKLPKNNKSKHLRIHAVVEPSLDWLGPILESRSNTLDPEWFLANV